MSHRLAILLRAINVGGAGKLRMEDLRAALSGLDFGDPRTLGAAGSAIAATDLDAATVEAQVEAALADGLGLVTAVIACQHAALAAIVAANPFVEMAQDDPGRLLVMFLRGDPAPADVATLRDRIQGREEIAAGPRCLYVAYRDGIGRSKFTTQLIERALGLPGTGRNWNTVRKLADLTA